MLPVKAQNTSIRKNAFARAIERFKAEREHTTRIGFLIDATSSRMQTWREAQHIQARMFRSVAGLHSLSLRLLHFGGGTVTDHGWMDSAEQVAATMRGVRCVMGLTQVLPGLRAFLEYDERPNAIIVIGDCFEEMQDAATAVAHDLKAEGVKVFSFLEGDDAVAAPVFRQLAEITGGKFARFGAELPLKDLCEGVALLTAGGERAVRRLKNSKVQQLLLTGPARK